jgi:magnesium chelatase family protein
MDYSVERTLSRAQLGIDAPLVQVEVHLSSGLPSFTVVGLPAPVVRESRERVRAALLSSGYAFPAGRITVNLAPVELSKQGGRFDLPIALALLRASGQLIVPAEPELECYGELGLDGELKAVAGLFLAALHAQAAQHAVLVPWANRSEVGLSGHTRIHAAPDLRAAARLAARAAIAPAITQEIAPAMAPAIAHEPAPGAAAAPPSLADVAGQSRAKRALLVAAAGAHGVLMYGPPGTGKSMLAARLPGLLPPLSSAEALEVASIASIAGFGADVTRWRQRPFRAPHHSASAHAIVGGGQWIRPGEISLAHCGVLFLDELPEFDRRVLEALREPMETGTITIVRTRARVSLPARFQLVAAMNPCPCGYLGDTREECRCGPARVARYRQRISGPLLDRIDIRVPVPRPPVEQLLPWRHSGETVGSAPGPARGSGVAACAEGGAAAQAQAARALRVERSGAPSAHLGPEGLRQCCALQPSGESLLRRGCERLALSGRAVHRLLALGRTIADLAGSDSIEAPHLAEALQLRRSLD